MKTSEQLTDLITALAKARSAFPAIVRNCSATARGGREYQYADLSTIADATSGVLAQHGLVMVQGVEDGDNGQLCIRSTLYHTSGQWLQCALSVPKPASMQEVGAISTYIRRYQQSSLLNISTEDDDDASSTVGATTEPKATLPASNGHTPASEPDESLAHPTEGHIAALRNLALTECGEDLEVYEQRIRQVMGLKPHASVAPKLLTRTQSMAQYMELFAYYRRLEAQLSKGKETPGGTTPQESAAAQPASAATGEGLPAVPPPASAAASSSAAPDPTAAVERDRQRLRAEVASWNLRISDKEREHVIVHNSYSRARQLLWQTRVDAPAATTIESAAD